MPRVTELQGYRMAVIDTTIPVVDEKDGQPVRGMDGQIKQQTCKQIILFDQLGDTVKVTLPEDARQELVRLLTGGVIVPELEIAKH